MDKDQWLLERRGKFTASQIFKLFSKPSDIKKRQMFGTGAWTYIEERAMERLTDLYERGSLEEVEALRHGKYMEGQAYRYYVEKSGNHSMRWFGDENPLYLTYNRDSGGSPDGLMGESDIIHRGLELKCPMKPAIHWKYMKMKDQYDLKAGAFHYYCQCQFLMMITKSPVWDFASFDERFRKEEHKMKIIQLTPDKILQAELDIRIAQAVIERDLIVAA